MTTHLRRASRAPLGLLITWCLLVAVGPLAAASAGSVTADGAGTASSDTASLSDVTVRDGRLEALLTVPAADDTVDVDNASVRVALGDGPARPAAVTSVRRDRRAVMLLIDTSGSMGRAGIASAASAARTFLGHTPSDVAVGLATFADSAHVVVVPSTNRQRVLSALPRLRPRGETALYDGIARAAAALGKSGSRTVLLLSDGGDTVSTHTLRGASRLLREGGVRLDAVAFRTREADGAALDTLARSGHGQVAQAVDRTTLTAAFGAAATALAGQVRVSVPAPGGLAPGQAVLVTGRADGRPFRAVTTLDLRQPAAPRSSAPPVRKAKTPAAAAVPAPSASGTSGLVSSPQWLLAAVGAVFLGLLGLGVAVSAPAFVSAGRRQIRSMDRYLRAPSQAKSATVHGTSAVTQGALKVADAWAHERESSTRTALLLERADLPLRLNEWYVLRAVAVVVSLAVFWLWWHGSLVGVLAALLVGPAVGVVLPSAYLKVSASRRARKFETQLPDVLTLVASSLSTGFSLPQAIDAITRDASEPSAKEYSRALAETRIGAGIEDSLDRLAHRMDSTNLAWTVMAIRIQRQVGGNLAETLRTTAATLRERESLKRMVKGLSAEGRLSAYILIALPIGIFGYMMLVNRPYVSLLWQSGLGLAMLGMGVVSLVIGVFWMRKTVVVEV